MVTNHIAHYPDCCTFIFPADLFGAYLKADVPVDRLSYMADLVHFLCVTDHKHFRVSIPLCLRIRLIYCDFDMIERFKMGSLLTDRLRYSLAVHALLLICRLL